MAAPGVVDRVARLCREELTARELREATLDVLRTAVPFDAHVWLLTDPVTGVGTSPHAGLPMLPWSGLPELILDRYLLTAPGWSERVAGLGVTGVASSRHDDAYGAWGWLDLWRCGGDFTEDERELVRSLTAPLTTGIRLAHARSFVEKTERLDLAGPAVVLMGADLTVRTMTATAAAALHALNPPGTASVPDPIPAAAMNVGAALLATEAEAPAGPPWSRVHLAGGCWVTLRADRLTDGGIAVTIETSTVAERREVFALAHGLSPREREVLEELTTGADSRSIARVLALSEHTVNDHVRAVLTKTGSPTRQVLISRIAGG